MLENIVIFGSKQEASALVSAISNEAEPNTFEWEGEALEFRAVRGLLLSSSGCSGAGCLDAVLALRGLRALTLSFNGIAALQSLSALEQLQVLDLSHNRLGDLEAVRDLRSLHTLRCNNNQIESVEPLRSVITIRELWISNNNIPWESLINLQPNTNLKIIVMYSNPLETKPKIEEFLKAICPSLEQINGVQCGALDRGGSGDFLATADGRVMATQARAQLTPLQREDIAARTVRRRASSKSLLRSGSLRGALAASRAEEDLSAPPASAGAEGPLGAGADGRSSPSRSEPGVRVYKAQRNKKPSAIGQRYDQGARTSVSAAGGGSAGATGGGGRGEAQTETEAQAEDGSCVTVRFGSGDSAPVAVCLYPNGTGYSRWNRAGTVACSFEAGGRLFSSHRSGALAAVVAPDGSGSVMDEHGNSVLTLKSRGEALIYNTAGEIECTLERQDSNEQRADRDLEVITIYDGSARKKAQRVKLSDICGQSKDEIFGFALQWVFSDLTVEFSPARWEVVVSVSNGRADCKFSNLHGGSLDSGQTVDRKTKKAKSPSKIVKSKGSEHLMTDAEHDTLRSGIQSIMSQMDEMLSGMKQIKKK